jgi:probable O-glycosylation ligase (exosortase A-associated)
MPIRDLVLFALIFGLLPLYIARPYVGVLVWSWFGYMNPHKLTWGVASDFHFAQIIAAGTLLGALLMIIREGKSPRIPCERETILLLLLWGMFTFTTFFALRPDLAWYSWEQITKILLMTFLTIILVNNERRFRYLVLVIAISLGFWGFRGGIFAVLTGGNYRVWGPEDSFIEDNNALGLALNMVLPFLFYLAKIERNLYLRWLLHIFFFLTILAILFTYSRGALLGLVVVLGLLFFGLRLKQKVTVAIIAVVLVPITVVYLPDQWVDRMETIKTYKQDSSATGRIEAWRTSWRIALDKPLVGGGFNVLHDEEIYRYYNPEIDQGREGWVETNPTGAHSAYFEVLGENGFVTFGLFMLLLVWSIGSTRALRTISRENGEQTFYYYSRMLEVSLFGYAVTALFLELASFDLFYHIVALVIVLKVLLREKLQLTREQRDASGEGAVTRQSPLEVSK